MQFLGKLMNQTWENGKNLSFKPDFGHFGPNLSPQIFFVDFTNLRKWQEPCFGPDFGPFDPNLGRQIFYSKIWLRQSLDIMIRYHHVQYEKKLMIHNWET